tara:strand:- start:406 stop:822 length:417 start_codon:yes stop_codon:yes gene_type:complete
MGKFLDKVVEAVKSTPNDMMLGEKIRQMYHEQVSHEMVITEMSEDEKKHLITWKGDEWTNPDGTPTQAYLDYWTCELCGKHTHEVDYDYLGNGTNHLGCELKKEMEEDSGTSDFIPAENNGEVKHFADGFHDGEWERD